MKAGKGERQGVAALDGVLTCLLACGVGVCDSLLGVVVAVRVDAFGTGLGRWEGGCWVYFCFVLFWYSV